MRERAIALFEQLQDEFSGLQMELDLASEHVELNMDIPEQPGLVFELNVNLQNEDELHLSAASLWLQWFPADEPAQEAEFLQSVRGLLLGEYRIVETLRGARPVRAELQKPKGTGWETVGSSWKAHLPIPWRTSRRVVQNQG